MVATIRSFPGYSEAVAAEAQHRQEAWLGREPDICGIPVDPLSLRKILYLNLAKNPFINADHSDYTPYAIAEFLWVVSQGFVEADIKARKKFFKRLSMTRINQASREIADYLERAFFDSAGGGDGKNYSAPKIDWIASIIHRFASDYGYSPSFVLDMPYRQINQLVRCQKSEHPELSKRLENPSDQILAKQLEALNNPPSVA